MADGPDDSSNHEVAVADEAWELTPEPAGGEPDAAGDQVLVVHPEKKKSPDDVDDLSALSPLPPFEKELKRVPLRNIKAAIRHAINESNVMPIRINLFTIQSRSVPDKSFLEPGLDLIDRVIEKTCSPNYFIERWSWSLVVLTPKKK
jgi:hypothetical protein